MEQCPTVITWRTKRAQKCVHNRKKVLYGVSVCRLFRDTLHTHVHKCTPHIHVHMFISPWAYATHTLVAFTDAPSHVHKQAHIMYYTHIIMYIRMICSKAHKHTHWHDSHTHMYPSHVHKCMCAQMMVWYTHVQAHIQLLHALLHAMHTSWTRHERWVEYTNTHGAKRYAFQ